MGDFFSISVVYHL